MDYQELIDDHTRIDTLASILEQTVDAGAAASHIDVLLDELSHVVAAHLHKEDGFVYPELAHCDDRAGASGLVVELEALKRDWQAYLAAWRAGLASDDWAGFRASTLGMLPRLRERVRKETGLLYGMALREGLITLRPVSP